MTRLKKTRLFFLRQINQIRDGGARVLFSKLKKFGWTLFMSILAPLADWFQVKWLGAYNFIAKRNLKKLKEIQAQSDPDKTLMEAMIDKTIDSFKKVIACKINLTNMKEWINAIRVLERLYQLQGKIDEWNDVCRKGAEAQQEIIKKYELNDLGIEFIPKRLAVGSIGVYEHLEAYIKAGLLGLQPFKKLILLCQTDESISNGCYLNYWNRYVTVISDSSTVQMLAALEERLTIPLASHIFLNDKLYKSFLALGTVREQWIKDGRLPILMLSDEDYDRGWQHLKSFGLKQNDWFVCLHVRESGWRGDNSSEEDFRNADINTYTSAIKTITDAGGWVIRMGDPAMNPLPEMPRVIDYAHSDLKNEAMDIFLCAQCRFFIGTSSGLYTLAMAFGVPILMTNLLPVCASYYFTSQDLFLLRLCRSKSEGRYLNFQEMFSPSIGVSIMKSYFDKENIEIIENTEEEIRESVEEMLKRCNGHLEYSKEDETLQGIFESMSLDSSKLYGDENVSVNARIGRGFLRRHAALLLSFGQAECAVVNEKKDYDAT